MWLGVDPILSETWGREARFGVAARACRETPSPGTASNNSPDVSVNGSGSLLPHDVHYLKAPLPAFLRGRVALPGDAAHSPAG